jgi:PAS domain S-box-containing protein
MKLMVDEIHVLYVDDEPALLDLARHFLEMSAGFQVVTSTSARESLNSSALPSFDVIISDYQMPDMDGIAFLKEVRQRFGNIPFILFTGRGREEVVIEAINNGVDFYLQKGGNNAAQFAELTHKVRQAVARRKSENEITSIFRAVPVGIGVVADRVFLKVNDQFCSMTGYEREELEGKNSRFLYLNDEDYAAVGMMRERTYRDGTPDVLNLTWRRKDAKVIDVHITVAAIDRSNPTAPMTVSALDITKAKRDQQELRAAYEQATAAEEELRQQYEELARVEQQIRVNEERLAMAQEIGHTGSWEYDIATKEIWGSAEGHHIFGFHRGEGKFPVDEIEACIPERERVRQALVDLTTKGMEYNLEYAINPADGSPPRIIHSIARLEKNTGGNPVRVTGVIQDITDRRKTEEVVRQNEEKFRSFVENANDIIYTLTVKGIFTYISPKWTEQLGHDPVEVIGKSFEEFIHDDDLPACHEFIRQVLTSEKKKSGIRYRIRHRDGSWQWHTTTTSLLREDTGKIIAFLGICRDITDRVKAEEALRESEEKYRELVENANSIILKWDKFGKITFFNEFAQRFFGYSEKEILGKSVMGTIVPATESGSGRNLREMIDDIIRNPKDHIHNENENITRDGKRVWIRWQNKPLFDGDGGFIGQLCIGSDNTERKKAEEALARSEELYRIVAEESPDQIFINARDHTIQYANTTALKLFGVSPDQVIGKTLRDLFPPHIFDNMEHALTRVFETGEPVHLEDLIQFGDRELWIDSNLVPLKDASGKITSVLGVARDITARRKTEEELRESRHQLSEAMDIASLAYWEYDALTNLFTFNDRFYALYGTTAGREGGMQMSPETYTREFIHPDDQDMVFRQVEKTLKKTDPGYRAQAEHRIIRRDGVTRHISVRTGIIRDPEGHVIRTFGANQDITDRTNMEEALLLANKKLNLLSGITRHDIRNQLMILNGFVDLLHEEIPEGPTKQYISPILNASGNIADMIEFTKEYERIGTGAPVWQDLTVVLNTAVKRTLPGQIILRNTIPVTQAIFADPMLEKVFFNLLDNGIRHGKRVTEVRVSHCMADGNLVIVWEDNGVGIPAGEKMQIFRRGVGKNTGLGMFLAREILSLTGITITETGEPGRGARFEITVPHGSFRL